MYKLVIEGIDGKDPLSCPLSYEFESEEEAVAAELNARNAGLLVFLVTPLFP